MVPLIMPSASHDAHASANGVTLQKGHVAPHFDYLDLRNAIALASQDVDGGASDIT